MSEERHVITTNRQAYHDYFIDETVEAGIVLHGTEVKSVRAGHVNLRGSYARIAEGEAWLEGVHIAEYEHGDTKQHAPTRRRKLLLHRREIERLIGKTQEKGLTLVPTRVYFKGRNAKVEIALARGKEMHDKRRDLRDKDQRREIERALREHQR